MSSVPREYNKIALLNDFTSLGVIGALLGGFALSTLESGELLQSTRTSVMWTGVLMYFAVHCCTFSAISSWWLYRHINYLSEEEAVRWKLERRLIAKVPMVSFMMGASMYISGVSLVGYSSEMGLESPQLSKNVVYIGAGVLCMSGTAYLMMVTPLSSAPLKSEVKFNASFSNPVNSSKQMQCPPSCNCAKCAQL